MKENTLEIPQTELDTLTRLIDAGSWIKTKTYPDHMAHEYAMKVANEELFAALNVAIAKYGYEEKFYSKTYRYVWIGDWKYWSYLILVNRERRQLTIDREAGNG